MPEAQGDNATGDQTPTTNQDEQVVWDVPNEGEESPEETQEEEKKPEEKEKPAEDNKDKRISQLQRKYDKAVKRIETLNTKVQARPEGKQELTGEEKQEQQAQEYIRQQALEALKEEQAKEQQQEQERVEQMSEELDEVLDENDDLKESDILDTIENFAEKGISLTPRQAVEVMKEMKGTQKEKPKMPQSKRGSGDVQPSQQESEDAKKKPFDERMQTAAREAFKKFSS